MGLIPPYQTPSRYMAVEKTAMRDEKLSEILAKQSQGNEEVAEGEASQFHSQDSRGRALFGYTTPDQARIESRSEDGTVRGSYSYLDAWGNAVKVTAAGRLSVLLFWASSTSLYLHNLSSLSLIFKLLHYLFIPTNILYAFLYSPIQVRTRGL